MVAVLTTMATTASGLAIFRKASCVSPSTEPWAMAMARAYLPSPLSSGPSSSSRRQSPGRSVRSHQRR